MIYSYIKRLVKRRTICTLHFNTRHVTMHDMKPKRTFLYNKIGAIDDIITNYKNVTMTVTDLAKKWGTTPRSIQRLLKDFGEIRSVAEANKATVKLKDYSKHRVPDHLKAKRVILPKIVRYNLIAQHPFCSTCGDRPSLTQYTVLEVDHIDGNATNNKPDNLQVLCRDCNRGKR